MPASELTYFIASEWSQMENYPHVNIKRRRRGVEYFMEKCIQERGRTRTLVYKMY